MFFLRSLVKTWSHLGRDVGATDTVHKPEKPTVIAENEPFRRGHRRTSAITSMTSIPEYHVLPNTQRDSDAMSLNAFARSVQAEMARFRVREQQGTTIVRPDLAVSRLSSITEEDAPTPRSSDEWVPPSPLTPAVAAEPDTAAEQANSSAFDPNQAALPGSANPNLTSESERPAPPHALLLLSELSRLKERLSIVNIDLVDIHGNLPAHTKLTSLPVDANATTEVRIEDCVRRMVLVSEQLDEAIEIARVRIAFLEDPECTDEYREAVARDNKVLSDLIEFYAASRLSPSELKLSQFPRPVSPIGALAGTVNYAQLSGEHDVEEPEDMDITEMTLPSDISPELSPRANVPEPRVSDWERVWGVEKPANNHTHKNELASSEESTVQEVQASAPRESSRSLLPQMSRHMRSCDRWNLACIDCAVECADIVVSTLPWAIRAPARETV